MNFFQIAALVGVAISIGAQGAKADTLCSSRDCGNLIMRAARGEFAGCYVKLNIDGYNQMYIDGSFAGNYVIGNDNEKLLAIIDSYLKSGECRLSTYVANAPVVLKAATGGNAGCSVKLNIQGYNQVYVEGDFSGNYVIGRDDGVLENVLKDYQLNGKCRDTAYRGGYARIDSAVADQYAGCSVKKDIEGYLQLYIDGSFSGNFPIGLKEAELENTIGTLIARGECRPKTYDCAR